MKFTVFVLTLVLLAVCLQAQPPRESDYFRVDWPSVDLTETISIEDALADLDYFVSRLYEVHPNPFRYTEESKFLAVIEETRDKLKSAEPDGIAKEDFYFTMQAIAASLLDIHTLVSRPVMQLDSIFPLQIRIVEGRIYNAGSHDEACYIPEGAEILSINGVLAHEIVLQARRLIPTPFDEAAFRSIENLIIVYIDRFFELKHPYEVQYSYEGSVSEASLPTLEAIPPALVERKSAVDSFKVHMGELTVPVLVLNRFSDEGDQPFFPYVRDFFIEFSDAPFILIDARGNPGGSLSWGEYVLGHLTDHRNIERVKNKVFMISETAREKMRYELHNRYYHMSIPRFMWNWRIDWLFRETRHIGRVVYGESGNMIETGPLVWRNPVDRRYRYTGEALLMIDERTGSAAVSFAAMFKTGEVGTIIGRETAHPDSYTGELTWHMLPASELVFGLPISYVIAARGVDDGRGVFPDHEVIYSLEDIISGRDLDIELALELIESHIAD